jgi:alpha-L-fucosidase
VNDRWGSDNPPIGSGRHFGGYFSGGDRQQASAKMLQHKWENAFTIDSLSWGYARNDNLSIYLNITTILYEVVSTVAYGGNILINIGPTHDGRIPTIFQERLSQLGAWLSVNGEAIYETSVWREHNDTALHGVEHGVYYTVRFGRHWKLYDGGALFAIALEWPESNSLHLAVPEPVDSSHGAVNATLLGSDVVIAVKRNRHTTGITLTIPPLSVSQLPSLEGPWVFRIEGVE